MKNKIQNKAEYKETELGLLPSDWDVIKIQKVIEFERGTEPGSSNYNDKGEGIRFLRVSDISGNRKDFIYTTSKKIKSCFDNDVLITFDGSPGIVKRGFRGAFSSGIRKVTAKNKNINLDYAYYILQTDYVQNVIDKYSTGVTIKHASKSIPHITIPLPPLTEQRQIVYVLSTVQDTKEKTENVINSLKELKKSMMKHLFTYGAVSFEDIGKIELKETEIGSTPKKWYVTSLGDIANVTKLAGFEYTKFVKYKPDGEIIAIRVLNLKEGKLNLNDVKRIDRNVSENLIRSKLYIGDILLSYVGTVGEVGIIDEDNKYHLAPNVSKITVKDQNKVYNKYVTYYLTSDIGKRELFSYVSQTTQQVISMARIRKIKIPIPHYIEQQKIVFILSAIDDKIEKEKDKKGVLVKLFDSLLFNLMTAKIRVKDIKIEVGNAKIRS